MPALLLDLDGCIYEHGRPLPGAVEALAWVAAERIAHAFVTNTTSVGPRVLERRLQDMGIAAGGPVPVLTPAVTARQWLEAHRAEPVALFVPSAAREAFAGLELLPAEAERGAKAVVVGDLAEGWTFAELNRAFRLLMDDLAPPLLALGLARYWRVPSGLQLDVGPMVAALEFASGRPPVVLGKPAAVVFELAASRLGVSASELVMVGDDVQSDVAGAQQAGARGLLVRTGKFAASDLDGDIRPDAVLDSIADLPARWAEVVSG